MRRFFASAPARIAATYAVVSLLWIALSDRVAEQIVHDPAALTVVQTVKGWSFVGLTALLLYVLIARAEKHLRRQEGIAKAVLESVADAIFVKDRDGRYILVNPAAARMAGRPPEELIGRRVSEVFGDRLHEATALRDGSVLAGGGSATIELALDARGRTVEGTASVYRDDAGNPAGVVVAVRDVTEQRRADADLRLREAMLRQSEKMESVGRLAGGVAHDFNNLLTVITAATDDALAATPDDDPRRGELLEVQRAAARAAELTRQLLVVSRQRPTSHTRISVDRAVSEMFELLRRTIPASVRVAMHADGSAGEVVGDGAAVGQLVMNLAINAVDAMPDGGALTVETTSTVVADGARHPLGLAPGRYAVVRVVDTGAGMDDATRSRAVELFFTTKAPGQGTGLGLATADAVARQHGGALHIDSSPGAGTAVTVYLRQAPPGTPTGTPPAPDPAPPPRARTGEVVLLAEDETAVRTIVKRALQRSGYVVLDARHGADALAIVEHLPMPIDLLVTDVMMPEMGGVALAARLRERWPRLPVLYVSGYTAGETIALSGDEPRDGSSTPLLADQPSSAFLDKPFRVDAFLAAVRALLDQARAVAGTPDEKS